MTDVTKEMLEAGREACVSELEEYPPNSSDLAAIYLAMRALDPSLAGQDECRKRGDGGPHVGGYVAPHICRICGAGIDPSLAESGDVERIVKLLRQKEPSGSKFINDERVTNRRNFDGDEAADLIEQLAALVFNPPKHKFWGAEKVVAALSAQHPSSDAAGAALLADANSHYSAAQVEEMEHRREFVRSEILRCNVAIENGDSDPWWKEDRGRFEQELRELDAALAKLQPPVASEERKTR